MRTSLLKILITYILPTITISTHSTISSYLLAHPHLLVHPTQNLYIDNTPIIRRQPDIRQSSLHHPNTTNIPIKPSASIHPTHPPSTTQSIIPIMPTRLTKYTHLATWNVTYHKSFTIGMNTRTLNNLDLLHCLDSPLYLFRPNNVNTKIPIKNAMRVGHHLTVTKHIHLYLNIKTL